jgi:O-antigen/teichoic acid export membrane protein
MNKLYKNFKNKLDKDFENLLSKSIATTVVKLSGKVSGLILSILLARTLGASLLGTINLSNQIISVLLVIIMFGMRVLIVKNVAISNSNKDFKKLKNIIKTSYFFNGGLGFIITLLLLIFSNYIASYLFDDNYLNLVITIMCIAIVPQIFTRIHSYALLGLNKVWQSNLAEDTLSALLTLLILLLFMSMQFDISVITVAISYSISRIVLSVLMFFYWKRETSKWTVKANFDSKIIKQTFPFFIISLVGILQARFDIFVIGYFLDSKEIGLYTVAITLAMIPSFFLQILETASSPKIVELHNSKKNIEMQKLVQKVSLMLFGIGLLAFMFFVAFGKQLLSLWGGEFSSANIVLIVISFGQLFNMLSGPSAVVLVMTGLENLRKNLAIMTLCLNIIGSIILIKYYGLLGAAMSSTLIAIVLNVALIFYVKLKLNFWPIKFYKS